MKIPNDSYGNQPSEAVIIKHRQLLIEVNIQYAAILQELKKKQKGA